MKTNRIAAAVIAAANFLGVAGGAELAERKTLTLDGARHAIAAAVAQAHKNHAGGVIAIVDDGGNLMALERVDGTFAAGANISIGKARTAPKHPHNMAWGDEGGKTLYICDRSGLYRMRLQVAGIMPIGRTRK
jgi:hypothetical protein